MDGKEQLQQQRDFYTLRKRETEMDLATKALFTRRRPEPSAARSEGLDWRKGSISRISAAWRSLSRRMS
jgi:hypothetical protein